MKKWTGVVLNQVAQGDVTLLIEGFCIFGGVDIK